MILVGNMVEKMIKIYQIFFFQKNKHKTRSETQFHQNRPHRTDSSLYLRHGAGTTSSESGHNNNLFIAPKNFYICLKAPHVGQEGGRARTQIRKTR